MEQVEEKIIDLVDVVSEGKPFSTLVSEAPLPEPPVFQLTPAWEEKIAQLVREEVERLCRQTVREQVDRLVRDVLAQETEKALAREIETLKQS